MNSNNNGKTKDNKQNLERFSRRIKMNVLRKRNKIKSVYKQGNDMT